MSKPLPERPRWAPPEEVEEYRLVHLLGEGAMGQVHLAEDRLLRRLVAIKFIATPSPSSAARERFYSEARAIARLQHPNVVAVHRVGEAAGRPFLVSEYVRGKNLGELPKPLPWQEVLKIGIGLARGLSAAHRGGVLHRDIKPANAVISEGEEVKLLDFGLAELMPDGPAVADDPRGSFPERPSSAGSSHSVDATISLPTTGRGDTIGPLSHAPPSARPKSVVGTPLYMAPEAWRGEPSTPRGDVYSLGALLYELCAGRAPHADVGLSDLPRIAQEVAPPPLQGVALGVEPALAAIIARCLERDAALRFASGDALREALEQLAERASGAAAIPDGNPYRGLLCFQAEHRALFFGRSAQVRAVLERLRGQSFVLVAGDSGVGKSSLCRAGVLPVIPRRSVAPGAPSGVVHVTLGRQPLVSLAVALAPLLSIDEGVLLHKLREEPGSVGRELRRTGSTGLVLFVDQLEELCTLAEPQEGAAAAQALQALCDPVSGVRVLATARGDFLGRLATLPGLGDDLSPALYLLRSLSVDGLRDAVVGPAEAKGFTFESEALVDTLVQSARLAEGGLPLLQFALAELWEARDEPRHLIPSSALEKIGGVEGALARHANGILAQLPAPQWEAARSVLLKLTTSEGTRVRRTEGELITAAEAGGTVRAAIEALVRGRLLVAREADAGAEGAYEIAHEALLRGWDTLRAWLSRDAEKRAIQQRIERAALEWERSGRATDALWSDRQILEARDVTGADLTPRDAAFLDQSRRIARRRRLARWGTVLGLPFAAVLAALIVRIQAARERDRAVAKHVTIASTALEIARSKRREMDELRKVAFSGFDAKAGKVAEEQWVGALDCGKSSDDRYASAGQELEVALQLAPDRGDVRRRLGEAIYERAALNEDLRRFAQRDDLAKRLVAYDPDGALGRRWSMPARLVIESRPPGAEVALERYEIRDGRRLAIPAGPLGTTPLGERAIAQGSVVLTFRLAGRVPVRLPIQLGRDERQRISVYLPRSESVPEGFVYVPPGRSLFGSGDEDHRFRERQPIHPVETGAYLIARYEVTFADWIVYLRALPPADRANRRINLHSSEHDIELMELPSGGYTLVMRPATRVYSAHEGEKIHYQGRDRRADQDWLQFPIGAVSYDDAALYAAWLAESGRVPRARLCDEHEWERAARGADDRLFPGGDVIYPEDANHDLTYGRNLLGFGPDTVGSHPDSSSPFAVDDLAGNVWEWTVSADQDGPAVLRGGSWYQRSLDSASVNREPATSTTRNALIGARICATPAPAQE